MVAMPQLDRTSARALVDAGYMPLSHYIEMFGPELTLREVASPATAPESETEKMTRMLMSATFRFR
jgi:hypothetical protein